LIRFADIFIGAGCCKNCDWYDPKLDIEFDFPEHVSGISLRKIEIEKNQTWRWNPRIRSLAPQETQGFVTIANQVNIHRRIKTAQCLLHQAHVRRIILYDEYFSPIEHSLSTQRQLIF